MHIGYFPKNCDHYIVQIERNETLVPKSIMNIQCCKYKKNDSATKFPT